MPPLFLKTMTGLDEVLKIEKHWKDRDAERADNTLNILPGVIRKQLSKIAKKVKFMFKDESDNSVIELKIFQTVANCALTIDQMETFINQNGAQYFKDGKNYLFMFSDISKKATKAVDKYKGQEGKTMKDVIKHIFSNGIKGSSNTVKA